MSGAIGIGQIGCGMIGQGHAYALRLLAEDGDIRPVAAADLSLEAVESAQRICPFERIGTDAYAVIKDPDVQAVAIVTPTTTHLDLVRATLEAGKPLLCEKPLATDFATVREMCELVAAADTTAQVGFHSRFHPVINELRALVESNELGRPMGYVLRDDQYWPTGDIVPGHSSWRSERTAPGGALLEHSIHSADVSLVDVRSGGASFAAPQRVRVRRGGRGCVHGGARRGSSAPSSRSSTACGREERRLEVFFEQVRSRSRPISSSVHPKTASSSSGPTAAAQRLDSRRVARPLLRRGGITHRTSWSICIRSAGVRAGGAAQPARITRLRDVAPMRSSKRRIGRGERSAGGADGRPVDRLIVGRLVVVGREVDDIIDDERGAGRRRRSGSRAARPELHVHVQLTQAHALATGRSAHAGRVHELDAIKLEDQLRRVRGQSLEDASTDDTGGEHVEDAADSRGANAEVVVHDDYGRGVRHDPCLPLPSRR
jgi:predicted dehydrogenase